MLIGGFLKMSTIDFPGEVSSVIFTQGCNLSCPYCHNHNLVNNTDDLVDMGYIFQTLNHRRKMIQAVAISGGEPTLQIGLPALCEALKEMGMKVKLDTNGTQPAMLKGLMSRGLVDYVAMDIKAPIDEYRFSAKNYSHQIRESIAAIMDSEADYEFRTTCVSPFVTKDNCRAIGYPIRGAKRLFLQQMSGTSVLNESFFSKEGRHLSFGEIMDIQQILKDYIEVCEVR